MHSVVGSGAREGGKLGVSLSDGEVQNVFTPFVEALKFDGSWRDVFSHQLSLFPLTGSAGMFFEFTFHSKARHRDSGHLLTTSFI